VVVGLGQEIGCGLQLCLLFGLLLDLLLLLLFLLLLLLLLFLLLLLLWLLLLPLLPLTLLYFLLLRLLLLLFFHTFSTPRPILLFLIPKHLTHRILYLHPPAPRNPLLRLLLLLCEEASTKSAEKACQCNSPAP
jgi:hypothetical protein